jgi:GTP-binding protein
LRHITRARVLVVLVELDPVTGVPPAEQHRVLLNELEQYRPELLDRPRLLVGSKADAAGIADLSDVAALLGGGEGAAAGGSGTGDGDDRGIFQPDLVISAVTGLGISSMVGTLGTMVAETRAEEPEASGNIIIHRPLPEGFSVERIDEGVYEVFGKVVERAVALNDVTTDEAADYIQDRLRKIGVDRALARAGARDGDEVRIGEMAFSWYRDQPEFTGVPSSRRRRSS